MPEEDASKNKMKVSRLGTDLDFGKLWKTVVHYDGPPSLSSSKTPAKVNEESKEDIALAYHSENSCNKASNSNSSNSNSTLPQMLDNDTIFRHSAVVWTSLLDTLGAVTLTKAIQMVFPSMNKVEARKYIMKVSRLAKRCTGKIPSAASQTTHSTASLVAASQTTWLTVLLTMFPDSAVSTVEVSAASHPMATGPNNINEVNSIWLRGWCQE
jgi:ribosomal protein L31